MMRRKLISKILKMRMCLLVLVLGLGLCACGSSNNEGDNGTLGASTDVVGVGDLLENPAQSGAAENDGDQAAEADNDTEAAPNTEESEQVGVGELLQVKGELYRNTGEINNALRCGVLDGEITSEIGSDEIPAKDNQSNFGTGYGYQYGAKNTIEVNMEDGWYVFRKVYADKGGSIVPVLTDVYSIQAVNGTTGEEIRISREAREDAFWEIMEKYEGLDVEKSENQMSAMGFTYWMEFLDEAGEPLHTVIPKGQSVEIDGVRYEAYDNTSALELFLAADALWEEDLTMGELLPADRQQLDVIEGLTMEATYATSRGVSLLFTNNSDLNIQYGDTYSLQAYKDGQWYDVGYIIENGMFHAIGYELPTGSTGSWATRYAFFHGELTAGTYRIVKDVLDFRGTGDYTEYYIGAEFEIK